MTLQRPEVIQLFKQNNGKNPQPVGSNIDI